MFASNVTIRYFIFFCRRKKKCIRYRVDEDGNEYFIDGDIEGLSDSFAADDSAHDSDSYTGSPMHSVASDDAFSTPSKSFCHNSPSMSGRTDFHCGIPGLKDEPDVGELEVTVKEMEDLDVTLTSTPRKSLPFHTNIPVTWGNKWDVTPFMGNSIFVHKSSN